MLDAVEVDLARYMREESRIHAEQDRLDALTEKKWAQLEKEVIGFCLTGHLFGECRDEIRKFIPETKYDPIIQTAVRYHSAYAIPENLDDETIRFCNILRDADKIDIVRVNVEIPLTEIYNIPKEEFYVSDISEEVLQAFESGDTVLRSLKKTAMDYVVGHISLIHGLVYPKSRKLVMEQGYLNKMVDFPTRNPDTQKQLEQIKRIVWKSLNAENRKERE